jgi:SAM-dependent methyltransferase
MESINKQKILKNFPEKNMYHKDTTSLKWKNDLIDFFQDKNLKSCLEIGTCKGVTTKVLSYLFEHVHTIENNSSRLDDAKQFCSDRNNITYILGDVYNNDTYTNFPKSFDAVLIDCMHLYPHVIADINRALTFFNEDTGLYLIFDDYGHPESTGVKTAVDEAINMGLQIETHIGEDPGFTVNRIDGSQFTILHKEGIILSYGK